LADNFPEACSPPIPSSHFTANTNLLVIPFTFFKNPTSPGMGPVTNITKEQAVMLMSSSGTLPNGTPAMPSTFIGGSSTAPVYLFGRDIGSGTRISVFKDIGFTGTPRQWTTNGAALVLAQTVAGFPGSGINTNAFGDPLDGFSSGGTLAKVVNGITTFNCVGYAGESDANTVGTANWISYEGISCTHSNVSAGLYPIWGYEHIYARAGSLNANKTAILAKIVAAMADPTYQATDSTFRGAAIALGEMKVKRGVDGGSFTTTPAAGF